MEEVAVVPSVEPVETIEEVKPEEIDLKNSSVTEDVTPVQITEPHVEEKLAAPIAETVDEPVPHASVEWCAERSALASDQE